MNKQRRKGCEIFECFPLSISLSHLSMPDSQISNLTPAAVALVKQQQKHTKTTSWSSYRLQRSASMTVCSLMVHKTSSLDIIRKAHRGCPATEQRGPPKANPRECASDVAGSWPLRLVIRRNRNDNRSENCDHLLDGKMKVRAKVSELYREIDMVQPPLFTSSFLTTLSLSLSLFLPSRFFSVFDLNGHSSSSLAL